MFDVQLRTTSSRDHFPTPVQAVRLLRPLLADITGTAAERRFFHSFRTVVASNGLSNHVANQSRLWDELAPALGHVDNAVKHSLVAMGAACHAYFMKREGGNGRYIRELEIFTIQQYNEAITSLIADGSTNGAPTRTRKMPDPDRVMPSRRDPMRHLEVILFCCLTFIGVESLRGNYRGAINHLFNGLRIIESELPYSLIATLPGAQDMAARISPSQSSQPGRKAKFGVLSRDQKPSAFLMSMLAIFSRYEVSATFFSANFHPNMMLRLFCPTPRTESFPSPEALPESSTLSPPTSPASTPAPLVREDGPLKPPQASPISSIVYANFPDAHFHFTILARQIYSLAHSLRSRRGDESFWGPLYLPLDLKSSPSPPAVQTSDNTPSSSSKVALVEYSVLKTRLAEMQRSFTNLISGPSAPRPGTKDWRSVRLDLLHMRCCDIHLKTLMFRSGAGNVQCSDLWHGEHEASLPPSWNSSSSPPSDKTIKKDDGLHSRDTQMSQVIYSLQQDFAYIITLAEEIQGIYPAGTQLPDLGMSCYSPTTALSPDTAADTPQITAASSPTSLMTDAHLGASSSPPAMNMQAFRSPQPVSQLTTSTGSPKPCSHPPNPGIARFTVDIGVISPMFLAALHVKDKSLRSRALAAMRSAKSLEAFWDGVALADLLGKMFSMKEDDDNDGEDNEYKNNRETPEEDVMEVLGTTSTATETMTPNTDMGKGGGGHHHKGEGSVLSDLTMMTEAERTSSSGRSIISTKDWKPKRQEKARRLQRLLERVETTSSGGTSILDLMELMGHLDIN